MAGDLVKAMSDLKEEEALQIAKERLDKGDGAMKILEDSRSAMEVVGKRFASGEYFIPDLIYSGEILKQISEMVKPKLTEAVQSQRLGTFILGTVAGDIHDIGKDIVAFMMDISGFEVIDLGVDVPTKSFVDKLKETKAPIIGLSGFLTLAFDAMKDTIEAIKAAGLRDKVKIMIGGGQIDEEVRKYTGADAYRPDAVAAVTLAREWLGGK
jgi:methanogenic corrinoid protein MtbC1